jgi:hypothetical protein
MQYLLRFLRRGPISPRVHGALDYLLAAALIAVPLAVDFHDDTATVLMLVLAPQPCWRSARTGQPASFGSCRRSCTASRTSPRRSS